MPASPLITVITITSVGATNIVFSMDNAQFRFDLKENIGPNLPDGTKAPAAMDFTSPPGGYGFGELSFYSLSEVYIKSDSGRQTFSIVASLNSPNDDFIVSHIENDKGSVKVTTSNIIIQDRAGNSIATPA